MTKIGERKAAKKENPEERKKLAKTKKLAGDRVTAVVTIGRCLTERAAASEAGRADWGLFPRVVLALLADGSGALHASAVEVYQERAFDLLNDRAPLTVGGKSAGLKVGGGGANHTTDYRANVAHEGTHPHGCSCRKCILAKERELSLIHI